jgi:ribosomal protein L11 methyltransferase
VIDYLLEISFDTSDGALDEQIQSRLFLTATTGSTSNESKGVSTIAAYFDTAEERNSAASMFADISGLQLQTTERERLNWLEVYQQSLEPLFIGSRFVVVPDPALLPRRSDLLTIVVPQEQAFGTGSHATTALCIELLESLPLVGRRGLDVGSGSGILALAMHRLGAEKVIAFDNDTDAYGALRDNRMRNSVDVSAMPLFIGSTDALRGGTFDVVTMNIIPEVILPLLPDVVARVADDGRLILSGILIVKQDDVIAAAASQQLWLADERARGEWWAGVFERL